MSELERERETKMGRRKKRVGKREWVTKNEREKEKGKDREVE